MKRRADSSTSADDVAADDHLHEAFADKVQGFVQAELQPFRDRVPPEGVERVRIHSDVFPLPPADPVD